MNKNTRQVSINDYTKHELDFCVKISNGEDTTIDDIITLSDMNSKNLKDIGFIEYE